MVPTLPATAAPAATAASVLIPGTGGNPAPPAPLPPQAPPPTTPNPFPWLPLLVGGGIFGAIVAILIIIVNSFGGNKSQLKPLLVADGILAGIAAVMIIIVNSLGAGFLVPALLGGGGILAGIVAVLIIIVNSFGAGGKGASFYPPDPGKPAGLNDGGSSKMGAQPHMDDGSIGNPDFHDGSDKMGAQPHMDVSDGMQVPGTPDAPAGINQKGL